MSDSCGQPSSQPFAHYDLDSCSWRTSQAWLPIETPSDSFLVDWPNQGSMYGGSTYEVPMSERHIRDAASSLLRAQTSPSGADETSPSPLPGDSLLPTPAAMNPNETEDLEKWAARRAGMKAKGYNGNGCGTPLGVALRLLPTPRASLNEDRQTKRTPSQEDGTHGLNLATEVALLPTPTRSDSTGAGHIEREGADSLRTAVESKLLPTPASRDSKGEQKGKFHREGGDSLPDVTKLLPTVTVGDQRGSRNNSSRTEEGRKGHTGTTLSDVFHPGADTSEPSPDGKPSSEPSTPILTLPLDD